MSGDVVGSISGEIGLDVVMPDLALGRSVPPRKLSLALGDRRLGEEEEYGQQNPQEPAICQEPQHMLEVYLRTNNQLGPKTQPDRVKPGQAAWGKRRRIGGGRPAEPRLDPINPFVSGILPAVGRKILRCLGPRR